MISAIAHIKKQELKHWDRGTETQRKKVKKVLQQSNISVPLSLCVENSSIVQDHF